MKKSLGSRLFQLFFFEGVVAKENAENVPFSFSLGFERFFSDECFLDVFTLSHFNVSADILHSGIEDLMCRMPAICLSTLCFNVFFFPLRLQFESVEATK